MPNLVTLLTTITGRISRSQWWMGAAIVTIGNFIGTLLFSPDPINFSERALHVPGWPETLWRLVLLFPATAITIKRFNDGDWPWWLGYTFAAVWFPMIVARHFGLLLNPDTGIIVVVFFAMLTYSVPVFLINGILRGTRGPNRYGPDPVGNTRAQT
jgi:uncharacterized membrane protein YhaH (DUF805 family)